MLYLLKKRVKSDVIVPPEPPVPPIDDEIRKSDVEYAFHEIKGIVNAYSAKRDAKADSIKNDQGAKEEGIVDFDINVNDRLASELLRSLDSRTAAVDDAHYSRIVEADNEIRQISALIGKKPSFWNRILPRGKEIIHNYPPELKPEMHDAEVIYNLASSARRALIDFELDRAREIYMEAHRIYTGLPDEKKAKVYEEIRSLYEERKHAEMLLSK